MDTLKNHWSKCKGIYNNGNFLGKCTITMVDGGKFYCKYDENGLANGYGYYKP